MAESSRGAPPRPPPPEVPEYGEGEGMAASSWWESMADLRLCGKKVTNEQAKTIFTLMGALIVALVVVVIVSATGGGGGDGGDDSAVPSGGPRVSTNWAAQHSGPIGMSSDVRLSGANAQCSESGCSGRIEVKAPSPGCKYDDPTPVW
jgi:hypothetical protein